MQTIREDQKDWHPGQIEQRYWALAAEEAAHGIDVATALEGLGVGEAETRHVDGDAMGEGRDPLVEARAHSDEHLRADDFEKALEEIKADGEHREGQQGRDAAAGERPVVDLQHVEGAGQRQDVDQSRHREQKHKDAAEASGQLLGISAFGTGDGCGFDSYSLDGRPVGESFGKTGRDISARFVGIKPRG